MKKILSFLILCTSTFTIYAQTWSGTNPIWTPANVGIGTANVDAPLTVYGVSHFFPRAAGGGDIRMFAINYAAMNAGFISNEYPIMLTTGGGNQPLILDAPRIGVGTVNPQYKLDVLGTVRAREVRVDLSGADFVFEENYKLMPLNEVEKFVIEKNTFLILLLLTRWKRMEQI